MGFIIGAIVVIILIINIPNIIMIMVDLGRKVSSYNRKVNGENKTRRNVSVIRTDELYQKQFNQCCDIINKKIKYLNNGNIENRSSIKFTFTSEEIPYGNLSDLGYGRLNDGGESFAVAIHEDLKGKYKYDSDIKIEFYRETRYADSIGDSFIAYSVYSVVVYFNGKYIKRKELKKIDLES